MEQVSYFHSLISCPIPYPFPSLCLHSSFSPSFLFCLPLCAACSTQWPAARRVDTPAPSCVSFSLAATDPRPAVDSPRRDSTWSPCALCAWSHVDARSAPAARSLCFPHSNQALRWRCAYCASPADSCCCYCYRRRCRLRWCWRAPERD